MRIEDVSPEWWGFKSGFVLGGYLGSNSTRKKATKTGDAQKINERTAFNEDDQENLYNLVQVCVHAKFFLCKLYDLLDY